MRATSILGLLFPVVVAGGLTLLACGTDGGSEFDPNDPNNPANQDGGNQGSFGGGNQGGLGNGSGGDGGNCAVTGGQAIPKPVDILIVLDRSTSMNAKLGADTDVRRIDAVASALKGFLADPKSAGFGAGIQFFPTPPPAVGATACVASDTCGGADNYCDIPGTRVCNNDNTRDCDSNRDCNGGGQCNAVTHQVCSKSQGRPCAVVGQSCGSRNGNDRGTCTLYTNGTCKSANSYSCDSAVYANLAAEPAVPIALLPGAADKLTEAITYTQTHLINNTPTKPAFEGGILAAKAYQAAHPDRSTVLIFATDGKPESNCTDPTAAGLEATAKEALEKGVKTFFIGVFNGDEGKETGEAIAKGAGTTPIIVTTGANAEAEFKAALESIRNASLPCDYDLPASVGAADYSKLNVTYTLGTNVSTLANTTAADACLGDKGLDSGWYYDVNPGAGATPKKITLCPATCNAAKAAGSGRVDVVVGCQATKVVVK